MSISLPEIRVGEPIRHQSLTVFPLFTEDSPDVDYQLSDQALAEESIIIKEVDTAGSVPDLLVENKGDRRVLFLEGEELVGAKQNRVLNTSVLVAAHSEIKIPVSCVEQGRWRYVSKHFTLSGSHSPPKLRHALRSSVSTSLKMKRGHQSNQSRVWSEVEELNAAQDVVSPTAAMAAAFETFGGSVEDFQSALNYVEGASGVAVAVGQHVISFDVFDKPSTCEKVWNRLLSGVVFAALAEAESDQAADVHHVEELLGTAGRLSWERAEAVGEGDEYRAESTHGEAGSALALEGTLVHGSVITR